MDIFLQAFGEMKFGTVIIFIAALVVAAIFILKGYKALVKFHDMMQEKDGTLTKVVEKSAELETELKNIVSTQSSIISSIDKISKSQENLTAQITSFEKVMKTQSCNKLRDRIVQSYRYYTSVDRNPMQEWTEMEKDAFDRLFTDYENLGGDGYVHSTIEPAMNSLGVIDMTDYEGISTLMKSRKG